MIPVTSKARKTGKEMEMCLKGRDKEACVDMHPNVLPLSVGLALIQRSCDPQLLAGLRPGVL